MTNIANTIRELEGQRDLIRVAIASLKALADGKMPKLVQDGRSSGGPTIMQVVLAHLKTVGKPQTTNELKVVMRAAGVIATENSIQSVLSKRAKMKKDLAKRGRALWGLKEWRK